MEGLCECGHVESRHYHECNLCDCKEYCEVTLAYYGEPQEPDLPEDEDFVY